MTYWSGKEEVGVVSELEWPPSPAHHPGGDGPAGRGRGRGGAAGRAASRGSDAEDIKLPSKYFPKTKVSLSEFSVGAKQENSLTPFQRSMLVHSYKVMSGDGE